MTASWSDPAYETLAHLIGARTGLSFAPNRRRDAETGIRRVMVRREIHEPSRYLALLEAGQVPLDDLIVELVVGETYFLREPPHFDVIRHDVIPETIRRRGANHVLRVWSAGCATGEEAYSLAIVMDEVVVEGHVLATDISRAALQRARDATYGRWSLRGVDDGVIRRHFHADGNRWTVDRRLQRRVTFQCHNLAQGAYPSIAAGIWGMDLILCRNVLIYFERDMVARVAQGLYDSLADDGWLITGSSDPPLDAVAPFATLVTDAGVLYRRSGSPRRMFAIGEPTLHEVSVRVTADASLLANKVDGDVESALSEPIRESAPAPVLGDPIMEVQEAFDAGDYDRVLALTNDVRDNATAILRVHATANRYGSERAAREAQRRIQENPLCTELHLLHGILLLDVGQNEEAVRAFRRALYLDRSLAIANLLLGGALRRQGKHDEARRAYRNARDLARALAPEDPVPLADGERAGIIAEMAESELALLGTGGGVSP